MNILVLGPQGSGKGTQAKLIADAYGIPHVSTGEMFRSAITEQTPLGVEVANVLASGGLVSDELTTALVEERLDQADTYAGFVLDGYPRTLPQASALDAILRARGRQIDVVFFFDLSDEIATERMLNRASAEGRDDDTPDVIAARLEAYHSQTEPLVEYYGATGALTALRAELAIEEVAAAISLALASLGETS